MPRQTEICNLQYSAIVDQNVGSCEIVSHEDKSEDGEEEQLSSTDLSCRDGGSDSEL